MGQNGRKERREHWSERESGVDPHVLAKERYERIIRNADALHEQQRQADTQRHRWSIRVLVCSLTATTSAFIAVANGAAQAVVTVTTLVGICSALLIERLGTHNERRDK